jgi:surface protein
MNTRELYIKAQKPSVAEWVRPSDWLPMPTNITESDQIFIGLHAVIEDNDNYVAFLFTTSTGQYQVDWGDGSTPTLHDSNTIAQYEYDFATVSNSTLTSRAYKQAIITVTPVSGNLLTCNFQQRFVTTPAQNQAYSTGFLDCILSMPNASTGASILFGGTTVRHRYVERFDVKTIGNCTSMSAMFNGCSSIQKVPLFNTQSVTNMANMFFNCSSLQQVPLFNTSSVTSISAMFQNCSSLQQVPLFDTQNVISMSVMFNACSSLQQVPLFNTQNVTTMLSMFNACSSLQQVPLFNTSNVTNMGSMFNNCSSLQQVPLFNTQSVTNMASMFFNCSSLNSIPALSTQSITTTSGTDFGVNFATGSNSLNRCQMVFARTVSFANCQLSRDALVEIFTNLVDRSSTTSANINISGNWGATALSTADRDIALNKNWTITG